MEAKEDKQSGGGAVVAAIIVLVLIILPVIYVASVGPAVWLAENKVISSEPGSAVTIIYSPLESASSSPAVEAPLKWYIELFR